MSAYDALAAKAGVSWFDYQLETFDDWLDQSEARACLYFRTGAGKSITALSMLYLRGVLDALVVAPPSTHEAWHKQAADLGMTLETISHAKFRMKDYKLARTRAVIADEFHMFGGHGGSGWKKLDRLARGLQAPLILASATPNYNDAERVYCIQHILDPQSVKGGYLEFLYANCVTEQNPFSQTPIVLGFHQYTDAAQFLASMPNVYYVEDTLVYSLQEQNLTVHLPTAFTEFGYERRAHRMVASAMERRHTEVALRLLTDNGHLRSAVRIEVDTLLRQVGGPVLIFCNHATIAAAVSQWLSMASYGHELVDGSLSTKVKAQRLQAFKDGAVKILVGTASLATGTDGLDKMCDTLIILDDTDDDALRRQLIGRIMPRGADGDASKKQVHRINLL